MSPAIFMAAVPPTAMQARKELFFAADDEEARRRYFEIFSGDAKESGYTQEIGHGRKPHLPGGPFRQRVALTSAARLGGAA